MKQPLLILFAFAFLLSLVLLSGCSSLFRISHSHKTSLHFLDVGEGSATLIDSSEIGRILIDTGNPSSQIVSKLADLGIHSLDTVILTHPHPDHIGGIYSVVEFLQPKEICDNGEPLSPKLPEHRWYQQTVRSAANYRTLKVGEYVKGKNIHLEVLSPELLGADWNSNSLVLKLTANGHITLLMADGNFTTEKMLLDNGKDLQADILQVGHHGAIDASSRTFLQAVSPRFAIISVNKDNRNGYPHSTTIRKLESIGANLYFTHESGRVSFILTVDGIEIDTERSS